MHMLLVVVLVILAGFGLHGYIRGMVRVVFSLLAVFLTIGFATLLTPYIFEFFQTQTPLYDTIQEKCTEYLQDRAEEVLYQEKEKTDSKRKKKNELIILGIKAPKELQDFLAENSAEQAVDLFQIKGLYKKVGKFLAEQILQRGAWVLSFILISIAMMILIHLLDLVSKLPGVNGINHLGGLAIGLVQGLVVVWILFLFVILLQDSEWGQQMLNSIQENFFLKLLYENNIIEQIIIKALE